VKILVLHPGALGDLILALPALRALREAFPEAAVELAGNFDFIGTVANGYADRFLSLAALPLGHLFASEDPDPSETLFWRRYDRVLSWTGAGDPNFCRRLPEVNSGALIGRWRPAPGESRHVSELFVGSLGPWLGAIVPEAARVRLPHGLSEAGEAFLRRRGWVRAQPLVALHPGAGGKEKRWPLSRFRELARDICLRGTARAVILEGPAEPGMGREVLSGLPPSACILMESQPLGLVAGVLASCSGFVGNDSGIAHLAAGLGIPALTLFGPTDPRFWAPRGRRTKALLDRTGCVACGRGAPDSHTCLNNITVKACLSALLDLTGSGSVNALPDRSLRTECSDAQSNSIPPLTSRHSPTR